MLHFFLSMLHNYFIIYFQIEFLPRDLFYCAELKELLLCDNEIAEIPSGIGLLVKLQKLDISRNSRDYFLNKNLFLYFKFSIFLQIFQI